MKRNIIIGAVSCLIIAAFAGEGFVYGAAEKTAEGSQYEVLAVELAKQEPNNKYLWYDANTIGIEGKGWKDTEGLYTRLPAKVKRVFNEYLSNMAKDSAGLYVRFATDSNTIAAKWKLTSSTLSIYLMTWVGVSGLDLYIRDGDRWHEFGIGGKPMKFPDNEEVLASGLKTGGKMNEYVLYLPLYNGVESVEIGIAKSAKMAKGSAWPVGTKPIVIYGTSIVQGASASRPGMAYTNILQRRLNRPIINLGFASSAKLEPEMADLLCEIDAAVYVLDPIPNSSAELINERFENFVTKIRNAHPQTLIIVCESTCWPNTAYFVEPRISKSNAALKGVYERLEGKGIKNMFYLKSNDYTGMGGEAFVDQAHPNDFGFMRMADTLEPILRKALEKK